MRDVAIQGSREFQPEPCTDDGITVYLHTMFAVAHTPGASHWCTPGHNRGKASEALTLATPKPAPQPPPPRSLYRSMHWEGIDG